MTTLRKLLFVAPVVAVLAIACPVSAQDDEVGLAKGLIARGLYDPADTLLDSVKTPEALVLRGRALSGMARDEKDAKKKKQFTDEAVRCLEEAAKKGAKDAAGPLDLLKKGQFEPAPTGR